jgi:pantetheine-phosphate adenylyltransferase
MKTTRPVKKRCVYAGSFDPITNGHLWLIQQGASLFDELIVAIGVNPDKNYTFPLDERLALLRHSTRAWPQVRIETFENQYLVNYAKRLRARYILRGIRSEADYEFERTMRHINGDLDPAIVTVFLMPPREITEISSSFVKGLVGPQNWEEIVKKYVPDAVFKSFLKKFSHVRSR